MLIDLGPDDLGVIRRALSALPDREAASLIARLARPRQPVRIDRTPDMLAHHQPAARTAP